MPSSCCKNPTPGEPEVQHRWMTGFRSGKGYAVHSQCASCGADRCEFRYWSRREPAERYAARLRKGGKHAV